MFIYWNCYYCNFIEFCKKYSFVGLADPGKSSDIRTEIFGYPLDLPTLICCQKYFSQFFFQLLRNPLIFDRIFVLIALFIFFTILGIFTIPVFPISLELGVESTFPVAEASSSGILVIAGFVLKILFNNCIEHKFWG